MNSVKFYLTILISAICINASAQTDERDKKYSPPANSFWDSKPGASGGDGGGGNSSSSDYRIKSATTWEITALGRGALVIGHEFRLGNSKTHLSTQLGVNIFTDWIQNFGVEFRESDYGYTPSDQVSLYNILTYGKKTDGDMGLFFQAGLIYSPKNKNNGWELGVRVVKSQFELDSDAIASAYSGTYYNNVMSDILFKTINPYLAYREISSNSKSNFITSTRIGVGVRFFQYETYRIIEGYDSNGVYNIEFEKYNVRKSYGPQFTVMVSLGIGHGKKAV